MSVRITVQHALKIPAETEYSSRQHSVAMEVDVPEDVVAKGKEAIRAYVANVTAEVRAYVEDALGRVEEARPLAPVHSISRAVPTGRSAARVPGLRNGNGRRNGNRASNGHAPDEDYANGSGSDAASIRQLNFLRGLARGAGYSPDQLSFLAEEVTGKRDLRTLTKREASQMIDQLRDGQE